MADGLSDVDFERFMGRVWPLVLDAIVQAVERAVGQQPVTAHAGTIVNVDGAVAVVNTADGGQVPVTRATGASEGDQCVVLFVQGGRGFALGSIPQVPNNSQGSV